MKKLLLWVLLVCSMSIITGCIGNGRTVIYGEDDRKDYWQIEDPNVLANAKATGSLWYSRQIIDFGDGTSWLTTKTFGKARNLHYNERFWSQPIGAHCTVFLVKPNVVVTAGHCVDSCSNINNQNFLKRIVFGFKMEDKSNPTKIVENKNIYEVEKVLVRKIGGVDYAVITLDRDVEGIKPVKLASKDVKKGDKVYLIGYPTGLPIKYAPNAKVLSVGSTSFKASVDAYGGNSGSPVFNLDNEVVGILVKGATDFVKDGVRYRSNILQPRWYNGEGITKVSVWRKYINK